MKSEETLTSTETVCCSKAFFM